MSNKISLKQLQNKINSIKNVIDQIVIQIEDVQKQLNEILDIDEYLSNQSTSISKELLSFTRRSLDPIYKIYIFQHINKENIYKLGYTNSNPWERALEFKELKNYPKFISSELDVKYFRLFRVFHIKEDDIDDLDDEIEEYIMLGKDRLRSYGYKIFSTGHLLESGIHEKLDIEHFKEKGYKHVWGEFRTRESLEKILPILERFNDITEEFPEYFEN